MNLSRIRRRLSQLANEVSATHEEHHDDGSSVWRNRAADLLEMFADIVDGPIPDPRLLPGTMRACAAMFRDPENTKSVVDQAIEDIRRRFGGDA